jgi:ABC-type molybdate transport system substrate-binding protein
MSMRRPSTISGKILFSATQYAVILAALLIFLPQKAAFAQEKEIESITVLSDRRLVIPMSQLVSAFVQHYPVSVATVYGQSVEQEKKIEDGESADIFISDDPYLLKLLQRKGMVDVYTVGKLAHNDEMRFSVAVVAGENMTAARQFLEFLHSAEASEIFYHAGLKTP